jgi:drug/metabolite transporter (DMT)-like permease
MVPAVRLNLPALALLFNALVWGASWWPFRRLQDMGVHPLWATVLIYLVAVILIVALRPKALLDVLRAPALWVLVLAAGTTNATFNWGVVIGDVVRVVLLFYLMPLWSVLLARVLLKEAITTAAALRVALALVGAGVVLWPDQPLSWQSLPLPRSLPDWLGVLGGFSFALNNVMLRREAHRSEESRALAMFGGGMLVAGVLALILALNGQVPWPPAPAPSWMLLALLMSVLFIVGNLALQYGAARLSANVTAVVLVSEVVVASGTAVAFGAGTLNAQLLVGGCLIILASVLSALQSQSAP